MHYADNKTNYAIDYRLYIKDRDKFKSKIELAIELIDQYRFIPKTIWDRWYTSKSIIEHVEKIGKYFIGACKSTYWLGLIIDTIYKGMGDLEIEINSIR